MNEHQTREEKFVLENENCGMLRALYEFQAVYAKTISFEENEIFLLHQTSARQKNWWQVVSESGNVGFVPSNYVEEIKVEPAFLLEFLETAIENLKRNVESEINNIISRDQLIANLIKKKKNLEKIMRGEVNLKTTSLKEDIPDETIPLPTEKSKKSKVILKEQLSENENMHKIKHDTTKKSMSNSCVVEAAKPSPPIKESPSMSILASKLEETLSEISSSGATTTTVKITRTTADATMITKEFLNDIKAAVVSKEDEEKHEAIIMANGVCKNVEKFEPIIIEEMDVYQILESLRKNTNLSHELSQRALRVFISEMEALLPDISRYLDPIAVHLTKDSLAVPDNLLGETHDSHRLRILFSELVDAKNDTNQRSWMLYEDEADITNYLTELIRILVDADPKICRYEMSVDAYNSVNNLVLYYQMESRWSIRKLMLKTFKAMCLLDVTCVDILIGSVLPLELVQDMLTNPVNLEKLSELSVMLIMIWSAGHKMPVGHFDLMGDNFVLFMLNLIENPLEDDQTEFLSDVMINLLLAFNLQFDNFTENTILETMQHVKTSKCLTEKILLLINREDDPVFVLKHTKPKVNSVLKILVDLFSISETSNLFYINDIKVLIDILVRQLSDLSAGDPLRKWYLELCRRILRNTDYTNHQHRALDLMKIFTRIFCEETVESASDQQIVREISNEFSHIFKA